MAGQPVAGGRGRRPRRRTTQITNRRAEHIARWAVARTPAQRLLAVAETARTLEAAGILRDLDERVERAADQLNRDIRAAMRKGR